jgi:hypothetical protein
LNCGAKAFISGAHRKKRPAHLHFARRTRRGVGATRAAENGATVAELEAIFGWQGGGMASLYTRAANRARLAKGAISKLVRS